MRRGLLPSRGLRQGVQTSRGGGARERVQVPILRGDRRAGDAVLRRLHRAAKDPRRRRAGGSS